MSTGTTLKRYKRKFKKKLYKFLSALNNMDFSRLRPVCYLLLIAGILLAWSKLPTPEATGFTSAQIQTGSTLASGIRSAVSVKEEPFIDIVALFLPQETLTQGTPSSLEEETLYSFYLTGKELSYLAEGAITTAGKENILYLDGLNYTYHKNRLPFNKVTELFTSSGAEIISNQLYRVISTEDIFALFRYISYRSIGIMDIYPKNASGVLLSDYQEIILNQTGAPFTVQTAMLQGNPVTVAALDSASVVTMQRGFNLLHLIKEPNRITLCVCALFIAFIALLWYIIPRMQRIRIWFRIYRIRSKKRSTHTIYSLKKRF